MIKRDKRHEIALLAEDFPALAILGPRQVGKTTLAHAVGEHQTSLYLDLESPRDRSKLTDPEHYLQQHQNKLIILDEIHRMPELFQILRGLVDQYRRQGQTRCRFLVLGSASMELLQQTGETLAGRIAYVELYPFNLREVGTNQWQTLWLRGGFPDSFLGRSERYSQTWRRNFIRTYLERDIPQFGPRIPAETLRRFWTMLAH
ncbi:MAG: ATP-binding protein, partial [Pseudomonadota bacterium]